MNPIVEAQRAVNAIDTAALEAREGPDRLHWRMSRLEARLWWCEDEVCNCHEPQIDRITPNEDMGYPWIRREALWRGTFNSDGEGIAEMCEELRAKAAELGIPLDPLCAPHSPYGVRIE